MSGSRDMARRDSRRPLRWGSVSMKMVCFTGDLDRAGQIRPSAEKCFGAPARPQKKALLIDLHTGLGDYADGIILHVYPKDSPRAKMFNKWYDNKVDGGMDVLDNDKVDYENSGSTVASFESFYPDKDTCAMVVEYGTGDLSKILMALIKDNWLHVKGDLDSAKGKAIKKELLHMLYPNTEEWKTGVWKHASWVLDKTAEHIGAL